MQKTICLLPGDGIGPEIVAEAVKVLRAVEKKFGHSFTMTEALLGGAAIDAVGVPLPDATVEACKAADAVFLGWVETPSLTLESQSQTSFDVSRALTQPYCPLVR